ncbi:MAG: hypothetical protein J1E80_07225 [Desulfovibrionaceae bacterium]|nr:hypothetical protein [Desulfovibrionaceae bacterium]
MRNGAICLILSGILSIFSVQSGYAQDTYDKVGLYNVIVGSDEKNVLEAIQKSDLKNILGELSFGDGIKECMESQIYNYSSAGGEMQGIKSGSDLQSIRNLIVKSINRLKQLGYENSLNIPRGKYVKFYKYSNGQMMEFLCDETTNECKLMDICIRFDINKFNAAEEVLTKRFGDSEFIDEYTSVWKKDNSYAYSNSNKCRICFYDADLVNEFYDSACELAKLLSEKEKEGEENLKNQM